MTKDKLMRKDFIRTTTGAVAGSRDGAMSILIGIAARNSIESGEPVRIGDLTTLTPHPSRGV